MRNNKPHVLLHTRMLFSSREHSRDRSTYTAHATTISVSGTGTNVLAGLGSRHGGLCSQGLCAIALADRVCRALLRVCVRNWKAGSSSGHTMKCKWCTKARSGGRARNYASCSRKQVQAYVCTGVSTCTRYCCEDDVSRAPQVGQSVGPRYRLPSSQSRCGTPDHGVEARTHRHTHKQTLTLALTHIHIHTHSLTHLLTHTQAHVRGQDCETRVGACSPHTRTSVGNAGHTHTCPCA